MPLIVCATPVGHLKDITLRTLETLQSCDAIICEDTRVSHKLLSHYQIKKSLIVYNDANGARARPGIMARLQEGKTLALISDAGTPLISDPGYKLIQACHEQAIAVTVEPGASSLLPALILSGLPPYPFYFGGFFQNLDHTPPDATLIFFESPHRLLDTLVKLKDCQRAIVIARELTKIHEEVRKGSAEALMMHYQAHPPKGEIVIILSPQQQNIWSKTQIDVLINQYVQEYGIREGTKKLAEKTGLSRKTLYRIALKGC